MKKTKRNYINNPDLLQALIDYKAKCKEAEDSGEQKPQVPKYIGEALYMIADRLGRKGNFSGYTFLDDMKMDGVENCLLYLHNFNPEKTQNPFAYFTQIIWFAFLRRIAKEKKQMYVRYASSLEILAQGGTYEGGDDNVMNFTSDVEYINDFVSSYESKMKTKKNQKKKIEID